MSSPNPFTGRSEISIPVPGFLKDWGFALQEGLMNTAGAVEGNLGMAWRRLGLPWFLGLSILSALATENSLQSVISVQKGLLLAKGLA